MTKPLRLGLLICAQYTIVAMNFRFIAHGTYLGAMSTDAIIALSGWTLTRWVVDAKTWQERMEYVIGASMGSAVGIWFTN